ncbi:SH3 domain-containing protein [Paenactinomyces guangxiensis]|uniref:SH3 domain-containing protein n=2 Tax=Paenactinomyces guangxiensis TaxID=1490290 RepID=A0A7W2A6N9_9BACL|nr:SH3 domain-containing protein [Paenactinomyces guangxiensis]MBA4492755.1 SH3 domain-containing protein [Paenactinomyces guangxiensis]MBH8590396.1 SH3 domain-containing protein [Paenactinomyces guangxiensis]
MKWCRFVMLAAMMALVISFALPETTYAASPDYKIEINKKTNKLYLYKNGKVAKVYPVATGRSKSLTPEGTFPIVVKIVKPGWKGIPGGSSKNPLGERWNGISVRGDNGRTYGIHGTNNPKSIGTHASSGCVRMYNKDVIALYNTIYEGTPVWIHSGSSNNKWRGDSRVGLKPASGTVKITGDKVNARTGPSTGSFVVTQLKKGTVLAKKGVSGDWYQVRLSNGRLVFVYKAYASSSGGSVSPSPPKISPASGQVAVTVNTANVRANPSLNAPILTKAKKGSKFTLTGINSEWFRVKLSNGKTAYLHHTVAKKVASSVSYLTVNVNIANIRSAPSLSAKVLQRVSRGTVLTRTGVSGDFYQIKLKSGATAYIHKSVVK